MDALIFIWNVYSYHLNQSLPMLTKLQRWAIDIAHPYLLNHLPSALTPDTTDPRKVRLHYDDPTCMDFDDNMDSRLPSVDWQLVGSKDKLNSNKDATRTPLPDSPARPTILNAANTTSPTTNHIQVQVPFEEQQNVRLQF